MEKSKIELKGLEKKVVEIIIGSYCFKLPLS